MTNEIWIILGAIGTVMIFTFVLTCHLAMKSECNSETELKGHIHASNIS